MNASAGRILVIRGGAIGDFILTLPVLSALRREYPRAHLEVLGYPHIVRLAEAGGLVNRIQSIEARALAGFFARNGSLDGGLADYFSEFDLILSYLYDPDRIFQSNVGRVSQAQFLAGPHRPDETGPIHAARVFLQPLERLAIFDADPLPRLDLGLQPGKEPVLAIHPGSGSVRKNWAEENWADLLQMILNSSGAGVLLVGGEAEGGRLQRLAAALPPLRTQVAQSLHLVDLARRLQECTAFVGHDSGISHLAAALGLPGILLWGPSAETVWRPPHPDMTVLRDPEGLQALRPDSVGSKVLSLLARS